MRSFSSMRRALAEIPLEQLQKRQSRSVALAVLVVLRLWQKKMLLSIGLETLCYMLPVQLVF